MRFLKTFFRFCTITILCTTFTTVAWGYAVNKNSEKQDGITCSSLSIASCNSYAGCAVYYENSTTSCQDSVCNVVAGCKDRAGCAYYSAACRVIDAGYYSETGTNDYYKCPEGYYCREGTGHKYSDPCPAGTYNPDEGKQSLSDCKSCPAGTYNNKTGQTSCTNCTVAGTYCPSGSTSQTACPAGNYCPDVKTKYPCPNNSYCTRGSTAPTSCPSPWINSNASATADTDCFRTIPAGKQYRKSDNTNITCTAGGYCPGVTMSYGTDTDTWGHEPCPTDSTRTVNSAAGSDDRTDCYVTCPREEVPERHGYYPETTKKYTNIMGNMWGYPECHTTTTLLTCYDGYHNGYSSKGQIASNCYGYEYLVMFRKNKPSGASATATPASDQYSQTLTYGSSAVALTDNKYALKGWTFKNWNTTANGSGTSYTNKQSVQNLIIPTADNQQFNLYAQWQANTYTITYNSNKPSASAGTISGSTASSTHTYDTAKALTANGYSLTGWTFTGWNTAQNGSGTPYTDKASVKNLTDVNNGTITLYAQWAPNTYKVTLDKQGATGGTSEYWYQYETQNPCYYYNSSTISSSTCLNGSPGDKIVIPTKSKFVYQGYFTQTGGGGTQYVHANGNTINNLYKTNVGNITLFAKMTACACTKGTGVASCTITGTTDNKCQYSVSCSSGYTKDGTNGGATTFNTEGGVATAAYTASCSAKSFTISFHNDYYDNQNTDFTFPATYDALLPTLTGQTQPGRAGYIFAGYYDTSNSTGGTQYYDANMNAISGKKWQINDNASLYSRWTPCSNNKYCTGDNTEQSCPTAFIYKKSDFPPYEPPADEITDCYLNPESLLKDTINKEGVSLKEIYTGKIYFKGNGS